MCALCALAGAFAPVARPLAPWRVARAAARAPRGAAASVRMFVPGGADAKTARDVFSERDARDSTPRATKITRELGPKKSDVLLRTAVIGGAVATGGVVGLAAGAVSGVVGAALGGGLVRARVSPNLVNGRFEATREELGALLQDASRQGGDWGGARTRARVDELCASWGMPDNYKDAMLARLYTRFLVATLETPSVRTAEIQDLLTLSKARRARRARARALASFSPRDAARREIATLRRGARAFSPSPPPPLAHARRCSG